MVVHRELGIPTSYTLEASFCGPTRGNYERCHFNTVCLNRMGMDFCRTLYDLSVDLERVKRVHQDLQIRFPINAAPLQKKAFPDDDDEED